MRAEQTQEEWTGLIVDKKLWEIRQPQDLVRGVPDDQSVPQARPVPPPVWDGPLYFQLAANVAIGATFIPLNYIAGITAGDKFGVMLDSGEYFNTVVDGAPISSGVNITDPMPFTAASGNLSVDYGASGP